MLTNLPGACGTYVDASVSLGAEWLLRSTMLIVAGLFAAQVLRKQGAAAHSTIYRATFVAVLVCPIVSLLLNTAGLRVPNIRMSWSTATGQTMCETTPGTSESAVATGSAVSRASIPDEIGPDVPPAVRMTQAKHLQLQGDPDECAGVLEGPTIDGMLVMRGSLALLWFVGSSILMVRLFMGWRVGLQLRRSACPANPQITEQCHALAARMGVTAPEVLWSALTTSPVLVGIVRPVVLLPEEEDITEDQSDVLVHELSHLSRWDPAWTSVGRVATAALFFQPLIWLLMRRMVLAAEKVCDDYVIQMGGDRFRYARRLVKIAERHQPAEMFSVGMLSRHPWLSQRVARILDPSQPLSFRTDRRVRHLTVIAASVGTMLIGLLNVSAAAPPAADEPTARAQRSEAVPAGTLRGGTVGERPSVPLIGDASVESLGHTDRQQNADATAISGTAIGSELPKSEPPSVLTTQETGRFVIKSYKENLQKIRSGVFRITGKRGNDDRSDEHSISGLVAFDLDANLMRQDRREPNLYGRLFGHKYIRRPDAVFLRSAGSNQLSIWPPETPLRSFPWKTPDIRLVGIANDVEFEAAEYTSKDLVSGILNETTLTEAVKEDGNFYRLTWTSGANGISVDRTIWFDDRAAMCPIRMEEIYRRARTSGASSVGTRHVAHAKWVARSGVFVPVSVDFQRERKQSALSARVSYAFAWERVNTEVPMNLFSLEDLRDPGEKVIVIDSRAGKPVVVEDAFEKLLAPKGTTPQSWEKRYFNGQPYYIVPLEAETRL